MEKRVFIKGKHPSSREIVVKKDCLLLDFLLENNPKLSRNNVKSLLKNSQVLINGKPSTKFNHPLLINDKVEILGYSQKDANVIRSHFKIVYEDNDFFVIDKPYNLLSVANSKIKQKTAFDEAIDYVSLKNPEQKLYVVHRLDQDTSGVLIFAKKRVLKEALQANWNNLVSEREYVAVVKKPFAEKYMSNTIKSLIAEGDNGLSYSTKNDKIGKEAITHYEVIKQNEKYALVKISIDTGRKHQIRVHMRDIGHEIVGDQKYHSEDDPLNRFALHCRKMVLTNPLNDKEYCFVAKEPRSFIDLINNEKEKSL